MDCTIDAAETEDETVDPKSDDKEEEEDEDDSDDKTPPIILLVPPTSCSWSEWSEWSECPITCGDRPGIRKRSRGQRQGFFFVRP